MHYRRDALRPDVCPMGGLTPVLLLVALSTVALSIGVSLSAHLPHSTMPLGGRGANHPMETARTLLSEHRSTLEAIAAALPREECWIVSSSPPSSAPWPRELTAGDRPGAPVDLDVKMSSGAAPGETPHPVRQC